MVVVAHPIGGIDGSALGERFDSAWIGFRGILERKSAGAVPAGGLPVTGLGRDSSTTPNVLDPPFPYSPEVAAALARIQTMIDEGYRLDLRPRSEGVHTLHVIADSTACEDCLVPDDVLAAVFLAEVERHGVSLGEVRVVHGEGDEV